MWAAPWRWWRCPVGLPVVRRAGARTGLIVPLLRAGRRPRGPGGCLSRQCPGCPTLGGALRSLRRSPQRSPHPCSLHPNGRRGWQPPPPRASVGTVRPVVRNAEPEPSPGLPAQAPPTICTPPHKSLALPVEWPCAQLARALRGRTPSPQNCSSPWLPSHVHAWR